MYDDYSPVPAMLNDLSQQLLDSKARIKTLLSRVRNRRVPEVKEATTSASSDSLNSLDDSIVFSADKVEIDKYGKIGETDFTQVFCASCAKDSVALKKWIFTNQEDIEKYQFLRARILKLANTTGPNLLRVRGYVEYKTGPACLESLAKSDIIRSWPNTMDGIFDCLQSIASGLCWLHTSGMAHANFKPTNVLLSEDNTWVLSDAWLRLVTQPLPESTLTSELVYTAPEILRGEVSDVLHYFPGDIFSFGVLVYELFFGRIRISGLNLEKYLSILDQNGGRPFKTVKEMSNPAVARLILDCWADPQHRITADDLFPRLRAIYMTHYRFDLEPFTFWENHFCSSSGHNPSLFKRVVSWDTVVDAIFNGASSDNRKRDFESIETIRAKLSDTHVKNAAPFADLSLMQWNQFYKWFGPWFAPCESELRYKMRELFMKPWFFGTITREQALGIVGSTDSAIEDKMFLVRLSSSMENMPYTLDVRLGASVNSIRITRTDGEYCLDSDSNSIGSFSTVTELIDRLIELKFISRPCPPDVSNPYADL